MIVLLVDTCQARQTHDKSRVFVLAGIFLSND